MPKNVKLSNRESHLVQPKKCESKPSTSTMGKIIIIMFL